MVRMSGVYGIYRFDGSPVAPEWLEGMRAAMAFYGPDGGGTRIEGPVGFGHLLCAINPEDACHGPILVLSLARRPLGYRTLATIGVLVVAWRVRPMLLKH